MQILFLPDVAYAGTCAEGQPQYYFPLRLSHRHPALFCVVPFFCTFKILIRDIIALAYYVLLVCLFVLFCPAAESEHSSRQVGA